MRAARKATPTEAAKAKAEPAAAAEPGTEAALHRGRRRIGEARAAWLGTRLG